MFNLTNIDNHPSNRNYLIYRFSSEEQGSYFEGLLQQQNIPYEKHIEKDENHTVLFAIKKTDSKSANHLNNLTLGKFRQPFIPDPLLRIIIMVVSFSVLLLAIVGFFVSGK